jgi:lipopolysaccharide transport system ATP-binding protein
VYVNGAILGFSKKEMDARLAEIVSFSETEEFIDTPVQSYSSGMLVRLGFAVAVHLKPDILIVDEVLAVGDAFFRRKARSKMMEILHSGISVLFVSHNMLLISSITSRCLYLDKGRIAAIGPSSRVTGLYLSDSIKKLDAWKESSPGEVMASAYLTTPDVLLEEVRLHHPLGRDGDDFRTFDDIKITFRIRFLKKSSNVSFAMSLRDRVDEIAVGFSKVSESKDFNEGPVCIECLVVKNKLREGFYDIGFYVSDTKGGPLFKSHRVKSFRILADMAVLADSGSSAGYVIIDTQWKSLPVA